MDKELLEVILKNLERETRIASIIDFESAPALPKGENYTSTISRLTLKVVLGNGRVAKRSFIMKQMITEGTSGEFIKQVNVAREECQIYSVVHKHMNYLMEEFGATDEALWCKFIHYDPNVSCIILEDLKASGFSLVPRQSSLDLDHAILALDGLGRYHGMAKILEERGIISKDDYKPLGLLNDLKLVKCFCYSSIMTVSKVMGDSWGSEWKETAKKLKFSFDPFAAKWCGMGKVQNDTNFTVLNHGDCWSNNMMFKYDHLKRPTAMKFLDYQLAHHNTPCIDVTYFFYLGIQPAVRRSNYQLLLKTYYHSLLNTLDKFGFTGYKPTLEEVTDTMKRLEFLGLGFFLILYPSLISSLTDAFDLEKLLKTDGEEGFNGDVLKEPGIVEKLGPDIIDFVERHVSDLY